MRDDARARDARRGEGPQGPRGRPTGSTVRSWLVAVVVLVGLAAVAAGSLSSSLEVVAVVALLAGSAIAFGMFDGRWRPSVSGVAPDLRTSALAGHVLVSLDGVAHRRVELGTPWPQMIVGPTGAVVVEVCGLEGPLLLDGDGVHRRDDRTGCRRCVAAIEAGRTARATLTLSELQVPVRVIGVVASGTEVTVTDDAPVDVQLVSVDGLADVLARGPVLPMPVVDAAFLVLSGAATASSRR